MTHINRMICFIISESYVYIFSFAAIRWKLHQPTAGLQGPGCWNAATRLWRLQCMHICIRSNRGGEIIYHDGKTRLSWARWYHTPGKLYKQLASKYMLVASWSTHSISWYYSEFRPGFLWWFCSVMNSYRLTISLGPSCWPINIHLKSRRNGLGISVMTHDLLQKFDCPIWIQKMVDDWYRYPNNIYRH